MATKLCNVCSIDMSRNESRTKDDRFSIYKTLVYIKVRTENRTKKIEKYIIK